MRSEVLWVFDCDGVLVDTNEIKVKAMISLLAVENASPDFLKWAESDFRDNFGRSRDLHMESFALMAKNYGFELDRGAQLRVLEAYSRCVRKIYATCDFIPETILFIKTVLKSAEIYLVSASSQNELRAILPNRSSLISACKIWGGPKAKVENLKYLGEMSTATSRMYVGDSVSDAKAAQSAGFKFTGLARYSAAPAALRSFCSSNDLACYEHCGEISQA